MLHSMVLSLMACARLASGVAQLPTPPMYTELAMLLPLPLSQPPAGASKSAAGA